MDLHDRFLDTDAHMVVSSNILFGNSESGHRKTGEAYPIFLSKQSSRKGSEKRRRGIGGNAADPAPEDGMAARTSAFRNQKLGHKIHRNRRSQSTLPQSFHFHHP